MKVVKASIAILATSLFLSSCGSSTPFVAGAVVECSQIDLIENPTKKIEIGCLDGSAGVNIAAVKGPAIINVWGSWCEPCKEEIPYFVEFNNSKNPEIRLIGVDVEEKDSQAGSAFVKSHGITWPNLFDSKGVTRKYFGMGVPVTWFINEDGEVVYKKVGVFKSTQEIKDATSKYLESSIKSKSASASKITSKSSKGEDKKVIESIKGEVVSCSGVKFHSKPAQDLLINCLDGAQGFNVGAIQGPAIINVWGTWCPPCVKEIPIFVEFYKSMSPAIQLVGVDFQDGPLFAVKPYIEKAGITWPNFADQSGAARAVFGSSVPVTWFINEKNEVAFKKFGPVESLSELKALSKKYLGES